MYVVGDTDKRVELKDLPQSSVGAPCPVVLAGERCLSVACFVQDTPSGWDETSVRVVGPGAAPDGSLGGDPGAQHWRTKRVAIVIDLDWPVRHHPGIASGILAVARKRGWACDVNPFLFREVLGRTIHDEVRRAHLELAKRLLLETAEPLKRIASMSGFRDPQHLGRVFRAVEKRTPPEFRKPHADARPDAPYPRSSRSRAAAALP